LKSLFLAWQDSISRAWFPVGKLSYDQGLYHFCYLQGAKEAELRAGFEPIYSFPDFGHEYSSDELFPLFANRLIRPSRPEYEDFVQWLNLPQGDYDPLTLLAISGGKRKTDTFEVFPCPERDSEGQYRVHFFSHGIRYTPEETLSHLAELEAGQEVWMAHDFQNPYDPRALLLHTPDLYTLGYCPRYLVEDVFRLREYGPVRVRVERVNPPPTPLQFRVLCCLSADWPGGFEPFAGDAYRSLRDVGPIATIPQGAGG
jgi:hypothetical protein